MALNIISFLAFSLYLTVGGAQYAKLTDRWSFSKQKLILFGLIATIMHAYVLYRWIDTPFGQNLSSSTVFSLSFWLISLLTLLASLKRPLENLILLILPFTAISIPLLSYFKTPTFFQTGLYPSHLFHILISIAAFGLLGMAMFQATLLSLQNHLLRKKSSHGMIKLLPPIETMEMHLFQIIRLGFIFLSISLISAFLFADDLYTSSRLHKIILSWLAWSFFATLLLGRKLSGWRGPTAVRWTLMGTLVLIIAYFSSKLIF